MKQNVVLYQVLSVLALSSWTTALLMQRSGFRNQHLLRQQLEPLEPQLDETIMPASLWPKKLASSPWKAITAAMGVSAVLSFAGPSMTLAAGTKPDASMLFEKSAEAFKEADVAYKSMENEFTVTRKLLDKGFRKEMETGTLLHSMSESLSLLETQLQKLSITGTVSLERVRAEVDQLSTNVAERYTAAEQAAEQFAPPSKTAQLFLSAQHEAQLLEQDAKQLGLFSSTLKRVAELQKQAAQQRTQVRKVEDEVQQLLMKQTASLNRLQSGLADNVQYCRYVSAVGSCVQQGKKGVQQAQEAVQQLAQLQQQFVSVLLQKEVHAEVQALSTLQADERALSEQMGGRVQEVTRWEHEHKLSLRAGKSMFASFRSDFDSIYAQFVKRNSGFVKEFSSLLRAEGIEESNSNNKNNNKNKKSNTKESKEVQKEVALQSLLKSLDSAQSKGIAAEKITLQAKAKGLAEAQAFMKQSNSVPSAASHKNNDKNNDKNIKGSKPSSSTVATTSSATSSNQVKTNNANSKQTTTSTSPTSASARGSAASSVNTAIKPTSTSSAAANSK